MAESYEPAPSLVPVLVMQVGQILVEQKWVAPEALARALAEQRHTGKRICSLLIARGLLDADNAARALANQHNVPGVLQKHLEHRDPALARLLPAALARASFALPIGRTRNHELIVCVRDPRPELRSILSSAIGGPVIIAVAPAHQLEQLIKQSYEGMPSKPRGGEVSFDVDLSTQAIAIVRDEPVPPPQAQSSQPPPQAQSSQPPQHGLPAQSLPMQGQTPGASAQSAAAQDQTPGAAAQGLPPQASEEVEVDLRTRQIAVVGDGLGDLSSLGLGTLTLVELDDVRVTKDPSQSGQQPTALPRTTTTPYPPLSRGTIAPQPPIGRATIAPKPPARPTTGPNAARTTTSPYPSPRTGSTHALAMVMPTLDATIAALDRTNALDDATDLAMRYLAGRFHHAVLFTINEGAALGFRGYGNQLTDDVVHAITVPLSAPSIVQTAHDTRRLATTAPADAGAIQDRLARTLGNPEALAAVPIEVDARVAYVIAVGEPAGDPGTAQYDLERLGRVLGAAYQRLPR